MPDLNPLSHASISRAHDLKIGPFPVRTGLFYDIDRQATEQEAAVVLPAGFSDVALLPLLLTLRERLAPSSWRIEEWREHPFQVVIKLIDSVKKSEAAVRLHYNKKLAITNMVFASGDPEDQALIGKLLRHSFVAQSDALQDALVAIAEKVTAHGYSLIEASETDYRLQLVFADDIDAVDIQVYADKEGMVSSLRISRASSEEAIERFTRVMEASP